MKYVIFSFALFSLPLSACAAFEGFQGLINAAGGIINSLIGIVFAIALLFFFWGLAIFILNAGSEEKIEEGKRIMIWGIVALFIMASIWGIVAFIQTAFGITDPSTPTQTGYQCDNDFYCAPGESDSCPDCYDR